tara:strand:- start:411 stop:575 length:165 start_codon:yes stop_codon:yes gene_type:complete
MSKMAKYYVIGKVSKELLKRMQKDLHVARAEAGIDLESAKITPMDGDFMENFSG